MMVSNEEKRWIVVGITMFQVAAPVLRDVVKQGMDTHYTNLDAYCSGLPTPCTLKTLTYLQVNADPSLKSLKFQNVNNNFLIHGRSRHLYNYYINSSVDLAKLYLRDYLAQFSAFDESLDMTAILRLLGFASYLPAAVFPPPTQLSADDVRENVRNKWGHFDETEWTEAFFKACFAKLETLVKSLGLAAGLETTTLNHLNDWQTKGCLLCMGHAVDQNLLSLVQQEVKKLTEKYKKTENEQAAIQVSVDQLKKQQNEMESSLSSQQGQQSAAASHLKKHNAQFEDLLQWQEQQMKENKRVSEKLVSLEKTLGKELLIRVQGVEEGLAQTSERVKQLEEDVKGQRLKSDGPDVLSASSQGRTVPSCSSAQAVHTGLKQSIWSKVKGLFKRSNQDEVTVPPCPSAQPSQQSCSKGVTHTDEFLTWCGNQLRSCYNITMSQVMISPWNPDDTVHIDEVYVKLSLLKDDRKPAGTAKTKLEDYCEIFQSHGDNLIPKRIVVYGKPGIGKSTFTKKVAVDWARGEKEILKQFDVLLLVKLRDVCDIEDLSSMLEKAELLSADDPTVFERLYNFIIENQQKVLLVLDGYDEYSGDKSSIVHKIWRGTLLRDGFVLVTSRPTKEEELIRSSHARFQINGFDTKEQVKRFALKVLNNQGEVSEFTSFLTERRLWDMVEIPLLLLMLCLTWQDKGRGELTGSRASIYGSFLETLFNHMAAKHPGKAFASSDEYKEDLSKLGKLAFDALLEDCLYLKLNKLPKDIHALIDILIQVGFFQISKLSRSVHPEEVLFFLHKSIQEFLSAWFIGWELKNAEKGDLSCLSKIDSLEKIEKMDEVRKFVCELSSEAAIAVLSHLRSVAEKAGLIECSFSETPSILELSEDQRKFRIISLDCVLSCPASCRQDVFSHFLHCVNSVVVIDYYPQSSVVAREHLLNVSSIALPGYLFFDQGYKIDPDVLSIMRDLKTIIVTPYGATKVDAGQCTDLKLKDFYLKAEGEQMVFYLTRVIKKFRDKVPRPAELLRAFTSTLESPPQKAVDHASQNQSNSSALCLTENTSVLVQKHSLSFVREIELWKPTSEELTVVNNLLTNIVNGPRFIVISSVSSSFSGQLIESLVSRIPFTNNLFKLELWDINLTTKSAVDIAKSLHQAPNLQNLYLSRINLHSTVSNLAVNLRHVSQLTELRLSHVDMGEEECRSIAAALQYLPCLQALDLSLNPLHLGITELAKHFIYVHHLLELYLKKTGIGEEEVRALARSLPNISKLKKLDLSSNPLQQGITELAKHFIQVPLLTELYLRKTGMGEEEVRAVARSFSSNSDLKELDLSSNPLQQGITELAKHFIDMPHLNKLRLSKTRMGGEEVRALARNLPSILKLKNLDLSSNPLHQGITELAKHFIHVPHLTELKLVRTQIGEEEVTAVAHALKDVPELEELYLSFNPLGRGVSELIKHLRSIPQLRLLNLMGVKMTKKEASDLSTAAQEMGFDIWSDYHTLDRRMRTEIDLIQDGVAFDKE